MSLKVDGRKGLHQRLSKSYSTSLGIYVSERQTHKQTIFVLPALCPDYWQNRWQWPQEVYLSSAGKVDIVMLFAKLDFLLLHNNTHRQNDRFLICRQTAIDTPWIMCRRESRELKKRSVIKSRCQREDGGGKHDMHRP